MINIKNKTEIEYIRKSNRIIAEIFDKIKSLIKPGVTTKELDKFIEDYILTKGAVPSFKNYKPAPLYPPYPAASCISVNNQVIHGIPNDYKLIEGDIISIDIGTNLGGYFGDSSFSFIVGHTTENRKNLVERTQNSLYKAIEIVKEGIYLNEIGKAIDFYLRQFGYGIVRDFCGHGVGKAIHEEPPVLHYYDPKRKGPKLKEGMVLAIEPMINEGTCNINILKDGWTVITADGKDSAHFEHSIAVTQNGCDILSKL